MVTGFRVYLEPVRQLMSISIEATCERSSQGDEPQGIRVLWGEWLKWGAYYGRWST